MLDPDLSILGVFEQPVEVFLTAAIGGLTAFVIVWMAAAIFAVLATAVASASVDFDAIIEEAVAEEEAARSTTADKPSVPRPRHWYKTA